MSRCKACNAELSDIELTLTNDKTGEPEDLCFICLGSALDAALEQEEDAELVSAGVTPEEIDRVIQEYDTDYSYSDDYE